MDVEWIIVADKAEVVGDKLYVMGGGWDTLVVNAGFPARQAMSLAVAFTVPWDETSGPHEIEVEVRGEDGAPLGQVGGIVEMGQPSRLPHGAGRRFQLTADITADFPHAGAYDIAVKVGGEELRSATIHVLPGPRLRQQAAGR